MPYHIGGEIQDRAKLNVQTPESLKKRLNLDVRCLTEVLTINRAAKTVTVKDYTTGRTYDERYDDLVLSVGAMPFTPPIKGIDRPGNFALRNLVDMDKINDWIAKVDAKSVIVAGAGFIGVEMAEQLHRRGLTVSLVEALPQIMAPLDEEMAALLHEELEKHGVRVIINDGIDGFTEPTEGAKGSDVALKSGETLHADIVILGMGVRPDTKLAKEAGLKLGARGGIIVDPFLRTEDLNVWAVGDAIEVNPPPLPRSTGPDWSHEGSRGGRFLRGLTLPTVQVRNPTLGGEPWMVAMAGPANRQGRMVADNIFGKVKREYRGTIGTSVLRCFDLTCACTGVNERTVKGKGLPYKAIVIHPKSHAGYYPGACEIWFKLIFDPTDGRVLGAQAVGADLVEKRIDVVATAMHSRCTVDDLAELELCYAPPVGSAKDPVNYAGMLAQNVRDGLLETCTFDEVPALLARPDVCLFDVRTPKEVANNGNIRRDALNIEVDMLRSRLAELPKDKTLLVHCCSGLRAYYACRILNAQGFKTINLCGGYQMWKHLGAKKWPQV
jgi:NADPH-dependent 2,4-dienoyl-CoA reductase/sulfur reductase-like enzyme/rhodanese-related sulfurtransferase